MQVNDYIKKQKPPQKEILIKLRKIILKTIPNINEEMKMGVPWYECKFYLVSLKDHVNMGFAYNHILAKYQAELEGKGKYMRHIKFFSLNDINEQKLIKLIKATKKGYKDPHPKKK
ncbi:DUF1801 domain-containing protein [Patescibacteria group bacterium]